MDVVEQKIQDLIALAEPLRVLDEDDPNKAPLAGIVDQINRLRAQQERQGREAPTPPATVEGADAVLPGEVPDPNCSAAELLAFHRRVMAGMSPQTQERMAATTAELAAKAEAPAQKPRRKPGPKPKGGAK